MENQSQGAATWTTGRAKFKLSQHDLSTNSRVPCRIRRCKPPEKGHFNDTSTRKGGSWMSQPCQECILICIVHHSELFSPFSLLKACEGLKIIVGSRRMITDGTRLHLVVSSVVLEDMGVYGWLIDDEKAIGPFLPHVGPHTGYIVDVSCNMVYLFLFFLPPPPSLWRPNGIWIVKAAWWKRPVS